VCKLCNNHKITYDFKITEFEKEGTLFWMISDQFYNSRNSKKSCCSWFIANNYKVISCYNKHHMELGINSIVSSKLEPPGTINQYKILAFAMIGDKLHAFLIHNIKNMDNTNQRIIDVNDLEFYVEDTLSSLN